MRSDRKSDIRAARFAADRPAPPRQPTATERMARIRAAGPDAIRAEAARLRTAANHAADQAYRWPVVADVRRREARELRWRADELDAEARAADVDTCDPFARCGSPEADREARRRETEARFLRAGYADVETIRL